MVVAVAVVHVVEMAVDEVVDMVSVRDRLVAAAGAVHMVRLVAAARVLARAAVRVRGVDVDDMVIDVVAMGVMQVSVVEVVEVPVVHHGPMSASGSVDVRVLAGVRGVLGHPSTVCPPAAGVQAPQMGLTRTDAVTDRPDAGP